MCIRKKTNRLPRGGIHDLLQNRAWKSFSERYADPLQWREAFRTGNPH